MVVNVQTSSLMGAWKSKHWYALRHCRGFNLQFDSKLEAPQNLGANSASLHRLSMSSVWALTKLWQATTRG